MVGQASLIHAVGDLWRSAGMVLVVWIAWIDDNFDLVLEVSSRRIKNAIR
jgi:hypothetical protein